MEATKEFNENNKIKILKEGFKHFGKVTTTEEESYLINLIEEKIMREKMTIKESIIYIFKIKEEIKELK